jgi:four helix bundle protein
MQSYRNLIVWQKAHRLVLEIYRITKDFPRSEITGMISQMRRSSTSIPTNIAEGSARKTDADYARFIYIALSSGMELDYQLYLTHDLKYISAEDFTKLSAELEEICKMLNGFAQTLERKR